MANQTGQYLLNKKGGGHDGNNNTLLVHCEATIAGGGWARVARLAAPWDGYCRSAMTPQYNLRETPVATSGKLTDDDVHRLVGEIDKADLSNRRTPSCSS